MEQYLYNALGVNVTNIYGFKSTSSLIVFSETGVNIKEKFPTEKQFLSWLNVVPNNKISGGKILSSKVKRKKNIAGQAMRDAANTLWKANNPLGEYLRKKKSKSGAGPAIVATARKIASIYYKMVTQKQEFDPEKIKQKSKEGLVNRIRYLKRQLETNKTLLADF